MDVELYVYDLSKGLARQWSLQLTGTHMDAIYHTSIVLEGVEYYFGHGIQMAVPGSTHHGQPMERVHLGKTELPTDVIAEYIQSLEEIYTPESYDLFLHNCNNFTQDLAMFLVGKSIPDHIRNLPQTFLSTPFGQMMKPQIEAALRPVTQGPGIAPQPAPGAIPAPRQTISQSQPRGKVRVVTSLTQLEHELASASNSCAVIFFTSATCPPCKMVYPVYDELAEEAGDKAVLIKADISTTPDIARKYPSIRGTPTFKTYLKGQPTDEWSGANPAQLRGNIRLLIEMAHPTHPHRHLNLPSFQRHIPPSTYVLYKSTPRLDKLAQKLHPYTQHPTLTSMITYITSRSSSGTEPPADHPLPKDLPSYPPFLTTLLTSLPEESHFAILDLTRILTLDPRIASYLAEEQPSPKILLTLLSPDNPQTQTPYSKSLTTLQTTCNLFSSPLAPTTLLTNQTLKQSLLQTLTTSLLSPKPQLRVTAASLAYNLTIHNHNIRFASTEVEEPLSEDDQVQLTASIVEAIDREEESGEVVEGLVFALGCLVYEAAVEGGVVDLCRVMGVGGVLRGKIGDFGGRDGLRKIVEEVAGLVDRF